MKHILFTIAFLVATAFVGFAQTTENKQSNNQQSSNNKQEASTSTVSMKPFPKGWMPGAVNSPDYELFLDSTVRRSGNSSGSIKSKESIAMPKGFASIVQGINAKNFLGKRVRLTAYIKSRDVKGWAGLYMQVQRDEFKEGDFDNMSNRQIKGTTDWTNYEVVLDVPADALTIGFGPLLQGTGQIWFDDLKLEAVAQDMASTNLQTKEWLESKQKGEQQTEESKRSNPQQFQKKVENFRTYSKTIPTEAANLDFEQSSPIRKVISVDAKTLDNYTGKYKTPTGRLLTLTKENNKLIFTDSNGKRFGFSPFSETEFFDDEYPISTLTFVRDDKGRVTHIIDHYEDGKDRILKKIQ